MTVRALLVGEAWGERELRLKHPLVGPTGRELTLMLGQVGFAPFMTLTCGSCNSRVEFRKPACPRCSERIWPDERDLIRHWSALRDLHGIHISNVFNEHPPNNDLGAFFGYDPEVPDLVKWKASRTSGGAYLKREFFPHLMRLWDEVRTLQPNLVVAMGNAACWALLGKTGIMKIRGTVDWSPRLQVKVLPTWHPAAILRQWSLRVQGLADLEKAARESLFPDVRRTERWVTIPSPDSAGLLEISDWLSVPANSYANDIETAQGQITMSSFARDANNALVIPFVEDNFDSFWPTLELEVEAWRLLIRGLRSPVPKVFQNGLYDLGYYLRMGIVPMNCRHDTMLWHHAEYPELPKSLGFLGSIYANEISWKNMRRTRETLKRDE